MRAALGLMEPPLAIPVRQRSVAMPLLLGLSPLLSPPLPPLPAHVRLTGSASHSHLNSMSKRFVQISVVLFQVLGCFLIPTIK